MSKPNNDGTPEESSAGIIVLNEEEGFDFLDLDNKDEEEDDDSKTGAQDKGPNFFEDEEEKTKDEEESSLTDKDLDEEEEEEGDDLENNNREKQNNSNSDESKRFRERLRKLSGGRIQTIAHEVDGELVETSIDDIEIDEELHDTILQEFIAREKEEASENKVSLDGTSELGRTMLEIDKRGGDFSEILRQKVAYIDPLDNIDMDSPEGQEQALRLLLTAQGLDERTIKGRILVSKQDDTLREDGLAAEATIREAVQKHADQQKDALIKQQNEYKEKLKNYKKDFKESAGKQFELNDAAKTKLTDYATKLDDKGKAALDHKLAEVRADAEKSARLALFLLDENEYIKQVTEKTLLETKKSTAIKLGTLAKKGSNTETIVKEAKDEDFLVRVPD